MAVASAPDEIDDFIRNQQAASLYMTPEAFAGSRLRPGETSQAYLFAAENLLHKAWCAWRTDRPKALAAIRRAATLPYDNHEETFPVAHEAHMMMFNQVVDELEAAAEGDPTWLDAALVILDSPDARVRHEMRDVLSTIADDYWMPHSEARRLQAAVKRIEPATPIWDLKPPLPGDIVDHIAALVDACVLYAELTADDKPSSGTA